MDGQKYFEWEHSKDHRDPCLAHKNVSAVSEQDLMLAVIQEPVHIANEWDQSFFQPYLSGVLSASRNMLRPQ